MFNGSLIRTGADYGVWTKVTVSGRCDYQFVSGFGDHNGLLGTLDREGHLYLMESTSELRLVPHGPHLTHVVVAGNDRVAAVLAQEPTSRLGCVVEFSSFANFRTWYGNATPDLNLVIKRYGIPGHVSQLVANATTFACLNHEGEVYTWGDARHRSLGRSSSGQSSGAFAEPGLVHALGGVKVTRISAGGFMTAALSEDGAAYLWGTGSPGKADSIQLLKEIDPSEVALIQILPSDGETTEPLDIRDLAVGDGHIVVLTDDGAVYTAGENTNGQLGLGSTKPFRDTWSRVKTDSRLHCIGVRAGPKCTFAKVSQAGHRADESPNLTALSAS